MKTKPIVEKSEYTFTIAPIKAADFRRIDGSKIESIEDVRLLIKAFNLSIDVNNEINRDIVHLTEDKA